MRNRNGLYWRQSKFLGLIIRLQLPSEQVMQQMKMKPSTLIRWMENENFKKEWNRTIEALAMMQRTDEITAKLSATRHERARLRAQATNDSPTPQPTTAIESHPAPAPDDLPVEETETPAPLSERECIRRRHGEEAAQAFDRLVKMREDHQKNRPAHPEAIDPLAASPPPTPPGTTRSQTIESRATQEVTQQEAT